MRCLAGVGLLALIACDMAAPPASPDVSPQVRPANTAPPEAKAERTPSQRSRDLAIYYARLENDLLNRGLLRVDGGGVDTPYTTREIARNFERIVFFDEYTRDAGFQSSEGQAGGLRKWTGPVRVSVEFGASVPDEIRDRDRAEIARYTARLARLTGHSISLAPANPNFHVLVMGEDDREQLVTRFRQIEPGANAATLQVLRTLPRSIHCLVAAFSDSRDDYIYSRAIAVIRAEHPELTRQACIHEELAQGLGLANDSPEARPSIFNDDDEFALLTSHDEELLRLLYNPALTPGMTVDEARPIIQQILLGRSGPS